MIKKFVIILWNVITVLMIIALIVGIKYFNFISSISTLIVLGIIILTYFLIPIFFNKPNRRKIRIIGNFFISGLFFIILISLILKSPGTPKQFKNSNNQIVENSISKWEKVKIGGIDQWLLVKGENKNNPVVLYLTGGFGMSSFFLAPKYYPQFEKDFTVVYWEQRGSGKSFNENIPQETMTFEQLTKDINEIAIYLKKKFNKEKIILIGHSWGTTIGLMACKSYPDNFYFFYGVGQIVNYEMNIAARYSQLLSKAEQNQNNKAILQIKSLGEPPYEQNDKGWKDNLLTNWADFYSGTTFSKNWSDIYYWSLLNCSEYTFSEKITVKSQNKLFFVQDEYRKLDFYNSIHDFAIPIYFVQGENDLLAVTSVVAEYYNKISSPNKDMFIIKNCGHDPQWDYPKEFHSFLLSKYALITKSNNKNQ
jgi:pimeloyl-ACP methyl ester carboxylesterase